MKANNCTNCIYFTSYQDICQDELEPYDVGECYNEKSKNYKQMVTWGNNCKKFKSKKQIRIQTKFKKYFNWILERWYLLIGLGFTLAKVLQDFYLMLSMIGFALIFIGLEIRNVSERSIFKKSFGLLTELMKNLDNKTYCPNCDSKDLTEIEDNQFICNYCSHTFTKGK